MAVPQRAQAAVSGFRTTPTTTPRPRAASRRAGRWNQAVQRQRAGRQPAPSGAAVRQGSDEHGGAAAGYGRLNQLKRHPRGVLRSLKVGIRATWGKVTGKNLVGMGRALIAPLRIGLQQAGAPCPAQHCADRSVRRGRRRPRHLVRMVGDAESTEPQLFRARRGVILGSGGFEHNEQMRVKYQRAPITTEWAVGAKANTGDGVLAAEKLGAALESWKTLGGARPCRSSTPRGSRCRSATPPRPSS